ncbi:MAG TPA: hypothetical protein V6C76_10620 [Drouetiella sp.]
MSDRISLRDLTTQLEHGDGSSVTKAFSGKFEEERFKDLDIIRKLNQSDLAQGKTDTKLNIDNGFYYNDVISISAVNSKNNWDEFSGGKRLYSDSLSMSTLQHTDPNDKVPGVRHPVDIAKLTTAAENGDGKAIETALAGKFQEERAQILKSVEAQNLKDLANHSTNATLDISVAGSKHSANTMNVRRALPGAHDWWMGGTQIYSESLDERTYNRTTSSKIDDRK